MNTFDANYLSGLVVRAGKNDPEAFSELYVQTYKKVYNYAVHYLRDEYMAQDALQEIYILAFKNLPNLKDPMLFIAWLNRIAFHVCFDMSKKRKETETITPEFMELLEDTSPERNPESYSTHKDEYERLYQAVDNLPFPEKQIITMRFINNMKIDDIAIACQISRSSVKRHIISGKELLRSAMED